MVRSCSSVATSVREAVVRASFGLAYGGDGSVEVGVEADGAVVGDGHSRIARNASFRYAPLGTRKAPGDALSGSFRPWNTPRGIAVKVSVRYPPGYIVREES